MEPDLLAVTRQCVERGQRSAVCVVSWRVSAACLVLYGLAGIHETSLAPEKGGSGESKVCSYMHCETARCEYATLRASMAHRMRRSSCHATITMTASR